MLYKDLKVARANSAKAAELAARESALRKMKADIASREKRLIGAQADLDARTKSLQRRDDELVRREGELAKRASSDEEALKALRDRAHQAEAVGFGGVSEYDLARSAFKEVDATTVDRDDEIKIFDRVPFGRNGPNGARDQLYADPTIAENR